MARKMSLAVFAIVATVVFQSDVVAQGGLPRAEGGIEYMSPSGTFKTSDEITVHCSGWIRSLESFLWIKGCN